MLKFKKINYFDEESITDLLQLHYGGKMEKTTELLENTRKQLEADGSAGISTGGTISNLLGGIFGLNTDLNFRGSGSYSNQTNKLGSKIIENTILSDFIEIADKNLEEKNIVKFFRSVNLEIDQNSLTYVAMISPYLSMIEGQTNINEEMALSYNKISNTLKDAKGYYEILGTINVNGKDELYVFRFNIEALRNNYKLTDFTNMDLSIYAIKVGTITLNDLKIENQMEQTSKIKNPNYQPTGNSEDNEPENKNSESKGTEKEEQENKGSADALDENTDLPLYDVIIAGVGVEKNED